MPRPPYGVSRKTRVPALDAGNPSPQLKSHPGPVGLNKHHEARLIASLVEYYGWTHPEDGNLYNPNPGVAQERCHAA